MLFEQGKGLEHRLAASRTRLYRIAYAWCHDAPLAEDLVQETLAKALRHRKQLRDGRALDKWLFQILANTWRDHCRRKRDTVDIAHAGLATQDGPAVHHQTHEIVDQVRAAVGRLDPNQRQVVTLVDLQGFAYQEVAEVLDIPIGTVMSRLCRARKELRELLRESGLAIPDAAQGLRSVK